MNEESLNKMSIEELRESLEEQIDYSYELRQRIDKAIEYIEHYKPVAVEDKILKILKGEENE